MTQVNFKFLGPDGSAWNNLRLTVRPETSFFGDAHPGIVIPRSVETVTDDNGEATLDLRSTTVKYLLKLEDTCNCVLAEFEFWVTESDTPLNFQDLLH